MKRRDTVSVLLRLGTDPNIPDMYGQVSLYWAARSDNDSMALNLIKHGALTNITHIEFATATDITEYFKSFKVLDLLKDWNEYK